MIKTEKKIEKKIIDRLSNSAFTWSEDIASSTIWGFKGAPYKTFNRAIKIVQKVIYRMASDGIIEIKESEPGYYPTIEKGINF